jgi:hypothetical protein
VLEGSLRAAFFIGAAVYPGEDRKSAFRPPCLLLPARAAIPAGVDACDNRHFVQATNQLKLEILVISDTTVFSKEVDAEPRFDDRAAGRVTLRQKGGDIKGAKPP